MIGCRKIIKTVRFALMFFPFVVFLLATSCAETDAVLKETEAAARTVDSYYMYKGAAKKMAEQQKMWEKGDFFKIPDQGASQKKRKK